MHDGSAHHLSLNRGLEPETDVFPVAGASLLGLALALAGRATWPSNLQVSELI